MIDHTRPLPVNYRIGTTDRVVGESTGAQDGFSVLSISSGKVFIALNGVWTSGGTLENTTSLIDFRTLLSKSYGSRSVMVGADTTLPSKDDEIYISEKYRVGWSDRVIGAPTSAPDGFYVLNTDSGNVFRVQDGHWIHADTFPPEFMTAWRES